MNEKRKLPPGIQTPTYELPKTDDYESWSEWMIRRNKEEYASRFPKKENVIQFHEAQGIRKYS